jgi:hypothetical protein
LGGLTWGRIYLKEDLFEGGYFWGSWELFFLDVDTGMTHGLLSWEEMVALKKAC